MRRSKRVISRAKMYGFNPWMDQLDAINKIMAETGEKSESAMLRKLIDEALALRSSKVQQLAHSEPSLPQKASQRTPSETAAESAETLATIQTLLLKLIRQGETSLRIQDITLALIQETLAEARASRKASWALGLQALKEQGLNAQQTATRFNDETREARNYAYEAAEGIRKSQFKDKRH